MWTRFMDMHSGGGQKEDWAYIYIEAPEEEAKVIFYNKFGHNPERVTCTCCGEDYGISEGEFLAQLTGYDRGCRCLETPRDERGLYKQPDDPEFHKHYYLEDGETPPAGYNVDNSRRWNKYQTLEQYIKNENVLVIYESEIKPEEREGNIPQQGYVWMD